MVVSVRAVPLSLRDFIWRSKVLTQFRSFLRAMRPLDSASARDARLKVRAGFDGARNAPRDVRAMLLADGAEQLAVLRKTAALAERATATATVTVTAKVVVAGACGTAGHVHGASCDSISSSATGASTTATIKSGGVISSNAAIGGGRASIGAPIIDVSDTKSGWVGTGPRDDERGRVGTGWPWG